MQRKSRRLFSLKCSSSNSKEDMITTNSMANTMATKVVPNFSIPISGIEKVINMRDLASYSRHKLPASLIYRSGCVSKASESDVSDVFQP